MHNHRNDVEKAPQELTEQIKTILAQRLYAVLMEAKIERPEVVKILGLMNASVDEVSNRYARHFFKSVDAMVKQLSSESEGKKPGSKSK